MYYETKTRQTNSKEFPGGGYSYDGEFSQAPLVVGQVWRNHGPVNAYKITRIMLPGFPDYDGAATGVSCVHSVIRSGGRIRWGIRWFHLAKSEQDFRDTMKKAGKVPVSPLPCQPTPPGGSTRLGTTTGEPERNVK